MFIERILFVGVFLFLGFFTATGCAADPAAAALPHLPTRMTVPVQDRNGLVLFNPDAGGKSAFPYGALAAQVLTGLEIPPTSASEPIGLTLDAGIQVIVENALCIVSDGAAVVVDAHNGDILAMASAPSFDPNQWTAESKPSLATAPLHCLDNRALAAVPPGSIFNIVTALAASRKDLATKTYQCRGIPYGLSFFRCYITNRKAGTHGKVSLEDGLNVSCGSYFCQLANETGIDEILATSALLGFGEKSGVPLAGEEAGLIPGPAWLKTAFPEETWSPGYTAYTAIGRGSIRTSPLQMALLAATIGNGGTSYYPRLLRGDATRIRSDLGKENVKPDDFALVRHTMLHGKAGVGMIEHPADSDCYSWFIAFAPPVDPRIAICVMTEGGDAAASDAACVHAGGRIIEDALGNPVTPPSEPLAPLAPLKRSAHRGS